MDKLLHDKLMYRVNEEPRDILNVLGEDLNCVGDGWRGIIKAIAEEIERSYIPRPRDNRGIPFVEGDIIYSIDPDTEYGAEVVRVDSRTLYILWDDGAYDVVDACDMQHDKPDSLEKLRDDMLNEFATLGRHELKGYANRLSALIERSA